MFRRLGSAFRVESFADSNQFLSHRIIALHLLDLQSQRSYSINEIELFPATRRFPVCRKIGLGLRPVQ
jgi:hypothetical protein